MTSAWQRIAALELVVEGYELERLAVELSPEFTRVTTVVHLHGAGHKGAGEDVTYSTQEHDAFQAAGPVLPLAGRWTIATFNEHLGSLDLFPSAPDSPVYRRYRRWGIESAALDLALRQADESLHSVLDRAPAPVRFVASLRLPEPPTLDPVRARLAQHADLRFKLDPTPSWDEALVEELAALDAVAVCDLKGYYTGTVVDNPPDPALYRRVVEAFPDAWIEDPALTPET